MQTGKSLLNYFPLQPWNASKSRICLCFIKCVLKNFVVFTFLPLQCNFLSVPSASSCTQTLLGSGEVCCTSSSCFRHLTVTLGICYLLPLMLFCTLCSLFQGPGCSSVGLFLKFDILKLHFWYQPKLFAQHHCPHPQSPTYRAVCISVKYFVIVIRTSISFQGGIRKPSRSANVWVLCCLRDELMQWHFKCNDLNTFSADCKVNGQMKHIVVYASLCNVLILCHACWQGLHLNPYFWWLWWKS